MSDQNELALVLSRIQALSNAKAHAAAPATAVDDGIPVLSEIYQGQDAFTAVELEQLFAPYYLADADSTQVTEVLDVQEREIAQPVEPEFEAHAESQPEPEPELAFQPQPSFAPLPADSSIRFLPVDNGEPENLEAPAHEELVAAVLADMQPVMSDVIRQALLREVQVLGPRLSAELEAALSESVRLRVQDALKEDEPGKS